MPTPDKKVDNATQEDIVQARKDMVEILEGTRAFAVVSLDGDSQISSIFFWPMEMLPELRRYVHEAITSIEHPEDLAVPGSDQIH